MLHLLVMLAPCIHRNQQIDYIWRKRWTLETYLFFIVSPSPSTNNVLKLNVLHRTGITLSALRLS